MATGTTSNDREFLFCLQTQIVDGGTNVLRNIFDQKLQNMPLNAFLATEKTSINRLRGQKTITKAQYDKLFPPIPQLPISADFDITLLICLLRNLQSFGLNRNYSWNIVPLPTDTSVEADLCRLKGFRNEVAHISSTTEFNKTSFQNKWTDIEQVLLRLNTAVPNSLPDLQKTLDSYKHSPLEPAAEQRIQADIERWWEMENALEKEIQLIKTDVSEVRHVETKKECKTLKRKMSEVGDDNAEMKAKIIKVEEQNQKDTKETDKIKGEFGLKEECLPLKQFQLQKDTIIECTPHIIGEMESVVSKKVKLPRNTNGRDSPSTDSQPPSQGTPIPSVDDEDNTDDDAATKRVIDKCRTTLIGYMNPEIILDCATEYDLFSYQETRDIREEKNTSEKNRSILASVRRKGNTGYTKLKDCLTNTGQSHLVELLECTERGEESGVLLEQIHKLKDLQDDLISFYRNEHRKISLSPLIEETTPLLEFYVMPDIYSLNLQRTHSGVKQGKTKVTPLRNVFCNDDKMCHKIYLTADAGLGKTALSKRLTLAWCQAKKTHKDEKQYFSKEETEALNEFRFVFLLLLRDSSSKCEIDDLIWNQIISLGHDYIREDLVNILCKERCLVILDGLDEWSHPLNSCEQELKSIPHQKFWERTTVLTTTRPWKLSASGLQSSQIDQKLELVGLNQKSANVLKRLVISHMSNEKNESKLQHEVEAFTKVLKEKQISDLEAIPLFLIYLLFLWCNKIELGQTQCDLYSQITELLLSRTVQNYIELLPKVDLPQGEIPQCFSGNAYCMQFFTLLTSLGQLAYETLFQEQREENTLVFDGSVAEQYLTKDCLNFCLKTGLITQSKVSVPGTLLKPKSKVSFAHKTMQEFFAALYMHSTSDQTSVPEIVLSKCKCIKDILEMSKILKFICGMNVNVSSLISREMMKIINEDEITLKDRSTLDTSVYRNPLKDFQDMCISCCREIPRENEVSLCLQDVFIEKSCQQEQYREYLKQLTTRNKQNIRSLYINMDEMSKTPYRSVHDVIDYFALSELENMEKIDYEGKYNDRDILPLLNKSVKCLHLSCRSSWSRLLFEKVTSLQKLEAINISRFKMSHSELTLLYDYISHRHCMRQIKLRSLSCVEHEEDSCSVCLELSHHSQLNTLDLLSIPVSELNINMASLEKCRLEYLYNPDLVLHFINCVPANSKLNTFECVDLESPVAIETMLETLRLSVNVERVVLWFMNLGDSEILSAEMVNIKCVELWGVTMTASVLQGIVDILQHQQQTVTVDIRLCDIKPESEFVKVKQEIKASREHFRVLEDIWRGFKFETIK